MYKYCDIVPTDKYIRIQWSKILYKYCDIVPTDMQWSIERCFKTFLVYKNYFNEKGKLQKFLLINLCYQKFLLINLCYQTLKN